MTQDQTARIYEALEKVRFYKPIYIAILKVTNDRNLTIRAIEFLIKQEGE